MADPPSSTRPDGDPGPDADLPADGEKFLTRDSEEVAEDPTGRLGAYLARTQNALDILALLTLWIVIVPVADFGDEHGLRGFGLSVRIILSLIYGVDMTIRTVLAHRHLHYLRSHPLGILAVIFPPVRVLFSLRLIRVLFRRGNLDRFLVAALFLMLNGALIVWLFEREAPGSNIHTLGESIWWSVVTVTTVGYGDYFPVTVAGEVVATFIMFIGIITVAVITAQVASSFVDQSARKNAAGAAAAISGDAAATELVAIDAASGGVAASAPSDRPSPTVTLDELDARLTRIEQLLVALQPPAAGDGAPGSPS